MPVKATRIGSGEALSRFSEAAEAVTLNADEEISREAKESAAVLFDYVRDLLDLGGATSFAEKLSYSDDLEKLLREIEGLGTAVYSAFRSVKITNDSWKDKTPIPLQVGYLVVVPASKVLEEMFVPRRFRLGF
ncbi:hypothetical protein [Methylocystis sp. H62]|uniref:hypothetical protein n=1 Tax=Methylocystis sp. H62 TaxID=2785789 RepID=UPI001FEF2D36|nr:hypothetical protein [Methylocystis sp. H62]